MFRNLAAARLLLASIFAGLLTIGVYCKYTAGVDILTFTSTHIPTGRGPSAVIVADVNHDRKLDVIVSNEASNDVTILLGDGAGQLQQAAGSPFPAGNSPNDLAVGDLNGDGALDLVIANHETKHVSVLLGNGRGSFKAAPGSAVRVQSKPHVHGVALGDFDQDGNLDIAVESWEDDQIEVIRGDGKGGFTTPGRMFAAGRMPYYKLRAGDANKDGRADVFTTNMRGASITVLLGTGVGALSPAAGSPFSAPSSPFGLAIGDLNGDGQPDVAVAHYSGSVNNRADDGISILLGDGRGAFRLAQKSLFAAGHAPVQVAIGDLNGDGISDIAAANLGSNDVTVLLGARRVFALARGSPFAVGRAPLALAIGDLNGDGKGDILTANSADNNITLLLSR